MANLSAHSGAWHAVVLKGVACRDVLDLFAARGGERSAESIELMSAASCVIGNCASSALGDNVNWITQSCEEGSAQFGAIFDLIEHSASLPGP